MSIYICVANNCIYSAVVQYIDNCVNIAKSLKLWQQHSYCNRLTNSHLLYLLFNHSLLNICQKQEIPKTQHVYHQESHVVLVQCITS